MMGSSLEGFGPLCWFNVALPELVVLLSIKAEAISSVAVESTIYYGADTEVRLIY
jgi:hypothetical protein